MELTKIDNRLQKLGFEKVSEGETLIYYKRQFGIGKHENLDFYKKSKSYALYSVDKLSCSIEPLLHHYITLKLKELGWIDE